MWRLLIVLLVGIIGLSVLMPVDVEAQPPPSSSDVTITAVGFVVAAPGDFTVWYISDHEVGISWTMPPNAANIMIRAAVGRMPENRSDGYEVYYGNATSTSDTAVSLDDMAVPMYYRAWSQTAGGDWEDVGASGFIEGIGMTLLALGIIALGLTVGMFATRNSMLGFPSGIFWGILGGYAYLQSTATWDWQYILFFGSMGMVIFAIFAAYGLRKKDLAGPDADEGAFIDEGGSRRPRGKATLLPRGAYQASSYADEEPGGDWGDIDRLGMHDTTDSRISSTRSGKLRERARRRRETFPQSTRWGEFG